VFRWANRCNTRRRHSAIGNITSNTYETGYVATTSATLAKAALPNRNRVHDRVSRPFEEIVTAVDTRSSRDVGIVAYSCTSPDDRRLLLRSVFSRTAGGAV
jgi:hypothetical protein